MDQWYPPGGVIRLEVEAVVQTHLRGGVWYSTYSCTSCDKVTTKNGPKMYHPVCSCRGGSAFFRFVSGRYNREEQRFVLVDALRAHLNGERYLGVNF